MPSPQFKITTTGTLSPVVLNDLGARSFVHPTMNYNLYLEFSAEEIRVSVDLQNAINSGYLTAVNENGVPITSVATAATQGANLTPLNKNMPAIVTGADGSLACITGLFSSPPSNCWPTVMVNGVAYTVGNGVKFTIPFYFSGNGGVTPRAAGEIVLGDLLYWNGSVAGFQLDTGDRIDVIFDAE